MLLIDTSRPTLDAISTNNNTNIQSKESHLGSKVHVTYSYQSIFSANIIDTLRRSKVLIAFPDLMHKLVSCNVLTVVIRLIC
jgi:hypothetical protein